MARYGVIAMEIETARDTFAINVVLNKPTLMASANVTNANSPPGAMYNPARKQFKRETLKIGPMAKITPSFPSTKHTTMARISQSEETNKRGSMVIPTVMKNNPKSKPRKGAISASTCK